MATKLTYLLVLIANFTFAQCAWINTGQDINLTCTSPCTTVVADYARAYATTSYSVSSIPYAPYSYTLGTVYNIPIDDRWSPVLNLPFEFCFYNQVYTQYVFSTNGIISFNLTYAGAFSPWAFAASIPTNVALFPRSMIGLFHDIDPSIGGTVRYGIQGTYPCRKLVLSFSNVPHFQCNTQRSTFQIVLHEITNIIEVFVERKQTCFPWNGGRACLGIQNTAGTLATFPVGRNTAAYTINVPEAWRFTPAGPETSVFNWYGTSNSNLSYSSCYSADSLVIGEVTYTCGSTPITLRDSTRITINNSNIQITPISHN